jgi:hypothetical protein
MKATISGTRQHKDLKSTFPSHTITSNTRPLIVPATEVQDSKGNSDVSKQKENDMARVQPTFKIRTKRE